MNLDRMLDVALLDKHITDGYISARRHPHLPLVIYNYTPKTQFEQKWDAVTRHCRGLIVDYQGKVVGNCLPKFFNWNTDDAKELDTSGRVQVTDKLDGSYLAVCLYENELVVATRGSFESEQAKVAKRIIDSRKEYQDALFVLCKESTAIFEIIYPQNRIVVDYGSLRDLVLIGTIANFELADGKQLWTPAHYLNWPGQTVEVLEANDFNAALAIPPRENAEGIVVYFENTGERVKIKQEDYLKLHRLMFNCTARRLWEFLAVNACQHMITHRKLWGSKLHMDPADAEKIINEYGPQWREKLTMGVPDEFYNWVTEKLNEIEKERALLESDVRKRFNKLWKEADGNRKTFATLVQHDPNWDLLFLLADNRSMEAELWLRVRPEHETPFIDAAEDVE